MSAARRRGFTLIELLVAIVGAIIITGVALEVLILINRSQKEVAIRGQLTRDAQLVIDMFENDLSYLGVGVPRGLRIAPTNFSAPITTHQLRPPIRIAVPDGIAFVGDLPYPNAELTGVVKFVDEDPNGEGEIMVASELCPCVPEAAVPGNHRCDCTARTLVQGTFVAADNCKSTQLGGRLCPWGMNKWLTQSDGKAYLILVDSSGSWHERRWTLTTGNIETDEYGLNLKLDAWQPTGDSSEVAVNTIDLPAFNQIIGSSYITQPDRVFWSFEKADGAACPAGAKDCVLRRRQCWGRVRDPGTATWPKVQDGPFRSTATPDDCTPGTDGTDWETVMTGVSAFTLRYFTNSTTELTGTWTLAKSSQARLVEVALTVERTIGPISLSETMTRRVFLRNHGGLLGQALADGGCVADGC
ncbi:MAG: prepilin-type N-terminal cleavage/methylation domain-containing protein [Deltaproteobacteria bacterium]|nr:prepilin-type N-terminal cleavage/methylation domain-containing protein [Deltaproteobacteria bacterium]